MFDSYLKEIIDKVPTIDNYNSNHFRSILSDAYLELVKYRAHTNRTEYVQDGEILKSLRKLADSFEYLGLFNENIEIEIKTAACFLAAEALNLLTQLIQPNLEGNNELIFNNYEITLFESGILYFIAGYDANSRTMIKSFNKSINERSLNEELKWALNQITNICDGSKRIENLEPSIKTYNLSYENSIRLLTRIGKIANEYHAWLTGDSSYTTNKMIDILNEYINLITKHFSPVYAVPLHICRLLREFIRSTSLRSVFHSVPRPTINNDNFELFLRKIILGDAISTGQLFLWPSAQNFVTRCLPGPTSHSIVCTPTGSGKSTIAKLAISHALNEGWVLYLAPTNALVQQIQRDLRKVTWPSNQVKVKSFFGLDEYTALSDDTLSEDKDNHIYVMTPEKCALALRVAPDAFKTCRLCIFDEFHELNSSSRGVLIDIIFGTLLTLSPTIRLQLISAMVENSDEIKDWLEQVSEYEVEIIDIKWRPTRTMRGVVGLQKNEFLEGISNATLKPRAKKKMIAKTPYFALFGLQGAWLSNETNEYRYGKLGADFSFEFMKDNITMGSWVNSTAEQLSYYFGSRGMRTITFFPKNKNYPFTVARNMDIIPTENLKMTDEINKLLLIANVELGIETKLTELFNKGITVHTSLMTQTEKDVSELAFKQGVAKVMLATSTLSQGLNLPAEVVLLAGTELGDEFNNADPTMLLSRKNSQFLNSIGRAGRAEFANQGLAIVIPSKPIHFSDEREKYNLIAAKHAAWFLEYQDASQRIESPLTSFLNQLIESNVDPEYISEEELALLPFFSETSPIPIEVLDNTYGAQKVKKKVTTSISSSVGPVINKIHNNFKSETNSPDWIFSSARKSGVTIFVVQEMVKSINKIGIPNYNQAKTYEITRWTDLLIDVLTNMNPKFLRTLIFSFSTFKDNETPQYNEMIEYTGWTSTEEWKKSWQKVKINLKYYVDSKNIKELGETIFPNINITNERTQGSFIPTVLKLLEFKGPFENLSRYAGVMVSVLEEVWKEEQQNQTTVVPFMLSLLPISIKHGLNNLQSVLWYRYGYRNRFAAKALGLYFQKQHINVENEKEIYNTIKRNKEELLTIPLEEILKIMKEFDYSEVEIKALFEILK
ncbi:DEAD/DEAH box helicase [Metabacillus idriensis]|uniref:DEAD/DEAH box helicase n=1 Tax=Metabacillus idriensis TaxID=324768 RepID=UPI002812ECD7|nr:DEAD/DEAH box helicase [Metabacillus idriensis]MDR0140193.1 DEAD/DEAH box helicase [Metabacillus idriensis]